MSLGKREKLMKWTKRKEKACSDLLALFLGLPKDEDDKKAFANLHATFFPFL